MKKLMLAAVICGFAAIGSASITQYFSEYRTIVTVPAGTLSTYTLVNSATSDGDYNLTVWLTEDDCASASQTSAAFVRWTSPDNVAHGIEFDGCGALAAQDLAVNLKAGTTVTVDTLSNQNTTGNLKIHAGILGFWS